MLYRKLAKKGPEISLLGYGCMRFPLKNMTVDKEQAFRQMKLAFDHGVNYFDTAYIYHAGKSEVILGEFIKKYNIRDKVYIADKLPTFLIHKKENIEKYFNIQLQRLDTDYIDFYLMHTLGSLSDWQRLKDFGIIEFINKKKEENQIKYLGFSFHGKCEEFIKILEDYPWDFCQIQFNYLDENYQAGLKGLKKAEELGINLVIMEPLRGGALAAKAPDKVKGIFKNYKIKRSPAQWGLKFVMNFAPVSVVLSGMNVDEHILDNIEIASHTHPQSMTNEELEIIENVKEVYNELMKVPCTACNYCMPCPYHVDIPNIFNNYNSIHFFGKRASVVRSQYASKSAGVLGDKSGANLCVKCGKCMKHCPQQIDIPAKLQEAHKALDIPLLRTLLSFYAYFLKKWKKKSIK